MSTRASCQKALAAVREKGREAGNVRLVPPVWENTFFAWLDHIQDWCISRQLWWGHRIPAFYDKDGKVYIGRDEAHARERGGLDGGALLTQDEDVLDTWFSSALWTFGPLGWPHKTKQLERYHPTQVMVTGFDILFFWVARMMMMSEFLLGEVPFREVCLTGLIRDGEGQKMSKTKAMPLTPWM